MEGIMSYGNDSDSQGGSEDGKSEGVISGHLHFLDKTDIHQPDNKHCVEQVVYGSDASETPTKSTISFNFLGLESTSKVNSNTFNSSLGHDQKNSRKVQISSGEVEIPNGDFWRDFTPDYTPTATTQGDDVSGTHLSHMGNACGFEGFVTQTNSTLNSKRLLCDDNFRSFESDSSLCKQMRISDENADHIYGSSIHPHDSVQQRQREPDNHRQSRHTDLAGCPYNSVQTATYEKRKLYYVHSNVSPYVNIEPVNKCSSKLMNSWPAHVGVVNRLAWNVPNFSHLLLTAGMDTLVRVWNVWSSLDRCVAILGCHKKAVKHAEWCQAGRRVLSCSYDRTAQVTDVETAKTVGQYEHMNYVTTGHIHPSNPNLFLTGTDNMVLKWDIRTPQAPVRCFSYKDKFGQVEDLLFINHGQEFVTCSELVSRDCADRSIMVWDMRAGTVLSNQIFQERYMCTRLKLHPSNSVFMAQTHADYVALFSTTSPYKMDKFKRYEGHKIQGHNIGFDISPDGALVYSGSAGDGIHIYHQQSGKLLKKLPSRSDIITDIACHPVLPSLLASCSWGGSVNLWK